MNKKITWVVCMFVLLTISTVTANNWIIEGDTVCTDNATWGKLCTMPHTLHGPGYAYCNATMAEDYGNIDFVWGFNTSLERPRSIDLYSPHWANTSSTQFFQNVSSIVVCEESCEIGHEYNDIKRNVTYDRCFEWNETTMECDTYEQVTQTVCFDSYEQDGNNYTVTWHNAKMKYWTDKTHLIESVNYNWNGMNKWYYIKDVPMPADVTKTVRIWIDMPAVLGTGDDTKFFFAAKRTTDTIQEAIAADRFMALDPWHNASRSHRKTVNVTHVNATGSNLLNYTVFLNVSKETEMQTDFDDILFYETDGTAMSFEYENHTTDYGLFWVLVPLLTATSDTQFWMYYGNDAATSSSNPESSWNVNCSMVQHLQEAPANDTAGHLDSTSNDNDGTPKNFNGTPTSTTDGTGIVDGADVFDGTDDYVDCGNGASLNIADAITIEGWINPNGVSEVGYLADNRAGAYGYGFRWFGSTNKIQFYMGSANVQSDAIFSESNEWVHIAVTKDSSHNVSFFKNGVPAGTGNGVIIPTAFAGNMHIGDDLNGKIDQVRIYNRALGTGEINQSFQLVENQSTFVTWGNAEQQSADTSFTVTLPSGYTYLKFEPSNSTATNVTPNGQTDSQEFYNVTNTGAVNLDVRMQLNETVTNILLKTNDSNNPATAQTISTSLVTIYSGLTPTNSVDIWLWSDFSHAVEQDTNKTISINVTETV